MRTKTFVGLILGLSTSLLLFAGCGGGTSARTCAATKDCSKDTICVSSSCKAVKCTTTADCVSGICDTATGLCTPKECTLDTDCKGSGMYCDNGICQTKVLNPETSQDAQTGDVPAIDGESVTETTAPVAGDDCKVCTSDADCSDGYDCIPLSAGKSCLKKCKNNGDCISGYICYAASTAGKNCVPPSYKCVKCATEGCPTGKVCNLSGGTCVDKVALCGPCTMDWECGIGSRCYRKDLKSKGICVPECKTVADCPQPQDKYACKADTSGTTMCQPSDMGVCCPSDKPHKLKDGTCVACTSATDCKTGEVCDSTTHTCSSSGCSTGQKLCTDDKKCHQCCEDTDCTSPQTCSSHKCIGKDACGGCTDKAYPYCVQYQGNPVCAACDPNVASSCKNNCTCDPNSFTCLNQDGSVCNGPGPQKCVCKSDTDCVDPSGKSTFKCSASGSSGFCYDPAGSCDGQNSCCDAGSGSKCFDLTSLLFGGLGGGGGGFPIPGGGGGGGTMMGVCSCDNGAKCPGGVTCFPLGTLCKIPFIGTIICPGGSLPAKAPKSICKDPSSLLGGL